MESKWNIIVHFFSVIAYCQWWLHRALFNDHNSTTTSQRPLLNDHNSTSTLNQHFSVSLLGDYFATTSSRRCRLQMHSNSNTNTLTTLRTYQWQLFKEHTLLNGHFSATAFLWPLLNEHVSTAASGSNSFGLMQATEHQRGMTLVSLASFLWNTRHVDNGPH